MMKNVLCVVVALAGILPAQDLLPELAPPAAKYKSAIEALNKEKQDNVTRVAQTYVAALNGVEQSAATAGKADVVAAVAKEREALAAGTLEPDLPAGLPPMRLRGSRQALLGKLTQINAEHARRKKQLDGSYINALITLQEKAASNPELAQQIAAEKAALLAVGGTATSVGGQKSKKMDPNNVVNNGDFEKRVVDGKPEGWENQRFVTVETEDNNHFVRFVPADNNDGTINRLMCHQEIEVPKGVKKVTLSARIRTKDCVRTKTSGKPGCALVFLDQQRQGLSPQIGQAWGGKNGSWKTLQTEGSVIRDAASVQVSFNNGACPGQIDFDDVEVTFK